MKHSNSNRLVLMTQSAQRIFCYFSLPQKLVDSNLPYKIILEVYEISGNEERKIRDIYIDMLADNWFIDLEKDNCKVFVRLVRIFEDGTKEMVATSNLVITPRINKSEEKNIKLVNLSEGKTVKSEKDIVSYCSEKNETINSYFDKTTKNTKIESSR